VFCTENQLTPVPNALTLHHRTPIGGSEQKVWFILSRELGNAAHLTLGRAVSWGGHRMGSPPG